LPEKESEREREREREREEENLKALFIAFPSFVLTRA